MKYIVYKRLKGKIISGKTINLSRGTECEERNNMIYYQGDPICFATSQVAHEHIVPNDDENGLERGALIQAILKKLSTPNSIGVDEKKWNKDKIKRDKLWEAVWENLWLSKYRKPEHEDFWCWSHEFYTEPDIEKLRKFANILGVKNVRIG